METKRLADAVFSRQGPSGRRLGDYKRIKQGNSWFPSGPSLAQYLDLPMSVVSANGLISPTTGYFLLVCGERSRPGVGPRGFTSTHRAFLVNLTASAQLRDGPSTGRKQQSGY